MAAAEVSTSVAADLDLCTSLEEWGTTLSEAGFVSLALDVTVGALSWGCSAFMLHVAVKAANATKPLSLVVVLFIVF
jgi:hypothetical protein